MRWLLHGALTTAAADALRRHGHETRTSAEAELAPGAGADDVFGAAHRKQLDVITTDANLIESLYSRQANFGRSIVLLNVEGGDVEQDDAIDRLFDRYKRLAPGRLYTVTGSRVKVRQLPPA
jgi:hypothetical protein